MNNADNVTIHSIPCPFGNNNVQIIIRDNIEPHEPMFARGDVISERLKSGPILYAMCPLALAVLHETNSSYNENFKRRMEEANCQSPECMYASAKWIELENFLR